MMKWCGWGSEDKEYQVSSKPALFPFMQKFLGVSQVDFIGRPDRSQVVMPKPIMNHEFLQAVRRKLDADQVECDEEARLLHTYGKSFRDLWRMRKLIIDSAPDAVLYPRGHGDVAAIVDAAHQHDVVVVPFGGGTNIVGGVEVDRGHKSMAVTVNMQQMNRILNIDEGAMTATIQAGILGPELEAGLNARGYSLGHYPDSFEFSTFGGWLATRSAGMQSDKYGKIEDMVIAVKMVTPAGTIETQLVPKAATGPDLNQLIIGSEGVFGIITEATVRIHKKVREEYRGVLFPDFTSGLAAIQRCVREDCLPMTLRLSNEAETALGFALRSAPSWLKSFKQKLALTYIRKFKGIDASKGCLLIIGLDGCDHTRRSETQKVLKICREQGGVDLGTKVGEHWYKGKYDYPYIRDFCMDHSIVVDVTETSTLWPKVLPMYSSVKSKMDQVLACNGAPGYLGCHLSHSYQTGACLYFTFAMKSQKDRELQQYLKIKETIVDEILKCGGSLSHHHAIGYEHMPWYAAYMGGTAMQALNGVKASLDPKNICNPGKLLPKV